MRADQIRRLTILAVPCGIAILTGACATPRPTEVAKPCPPTIGTGPGDTVRVTVQNDSAILACRVHLLHDTIRISPILITAP
jgi:hypothetical protein